MQQAAFAERPPEAELVVLRLECAGRAKELAPIVIRNILLTILTLGVYRFWAKTRVRRYLWSRTSLLGDTFEYTGTGGELFRGFLIVVVCVLLPLLAYQAAVGLLIEPESPLALLALVPWYAVILFLLGVAMHRARRYRFSRTSWRGIRGAQQGSAARYGATYLGFMLLAFATLGWAYPWMRVRLNAALTNDAWLGDRRFAFDGSPKPLYGMFAVAWLAVLAAFALVIGVLFLVMAEDGADEPSFLGLLMSFGGVFLLLAVVFVAFAWYRAREAAYLAACTRYEGLQLHYDVTAGALLWLSVSNLLLLIVTLGLGGAFVELRSLRFVCQRLSFAGELDVAAITQSQAPRPSRGEGLAEAFDVGAV